MSEGRKAVCVIGWPAGHSRSPLIHNYWIKQHNIDAEYRREAVPPEKFADFVAHLADARLYRRQRHGAAQAGGAGVVGAGRARQGRSAPPICLWYDGDTLRSTNTDVEGFLGNLDASTPGWDRGLESAMVLGAGGGARAVVYALIERDVQRIYVVNRTLERAQALQKNSAIACMSPAGTKSPGFWAAAACWSMHDPRHGRTAAAGDQSALSGLAGGGGPGLRAAGNRAAEAARERGLRTADGLGMLLHQAVRGFERWFGVRPEVTPELRALMEADLAHGAGAGAGRKRSKPVAKAKARRNKKRGEGLSA